MLMDLSEDYSLQIYHGLGNGAKTCAVFTYNFSRTSAELHHDQLNDELNQMRPAQGVAASTDEAHDTNVSVEDT